MNFQYIFRILINTPHSAHSPLYSVQHYGREEALFYRITGALEPIGSEILTKLFHKILFCEILRAGTERYNFSDIKRANFCIFYLEICKNLVIKLNHEQAIKNAN